MNRFLESAQLSAEKKSSDGTELEREDVRVRVCVCDSECIRDTHDAAQSRSVKLEWTLGPRLALIAFLSTSSCCIRVTFPLWGGMFGLLYIYLFHFLSLPKCTIFIQAVISQRWCCKAHFKSCPNTPTGVWQRWRDKGSFRNHQFCSCTKSHTHMHVHLWLCFTSR